MNSLREDKHTSIARRRLGPWTVVAVVHQAGAVPLREGVGALHPEEVELHQCTDSVPAGNPSQLAKRGIIRTKNGLEKPLRLEDRRRGESEDRMSKGIHT
jgi:hypothetical protein